MGEGFSGSRTLGTALIVVAAILGVVALAWLAANAAAGALEPGGFVLGLFFLLLFILPLVVVGVYVRRQGAAREAAAASFQERRKLLERDRMFRHTLQREAGRVAERLSARASESEGEEAALLRQAEQALRGLAEGAAQPVMEADWLHATTLGPRDVRDVERYDDLLLAAVRRIREMAERGMEAQRLDVALGAVELARSAERHFDLRQELVLRGRSLPRVAPLHLLKAETPAGEELAPESLRPGDAVSWGIQNYLVTAHVTYFAEGRSWHALLLRGDEGERRLQVEPGADRVLFMEPASAAQLGGRVEAQGSASVSIDSLSGTAEGMVVDYRRIQGEGGRVGWWERWPEGERAYSGEQIGLGQLDFWPLAVRGE